MNKQSRLLRVIVMEIAVVLLVHWALLQWLARKQVVASLLAAGEHLPRATVALAVIFLMVRFLAIFILPGVVCSRLVQLAFCNFVEKPRELAESQQHANAESNPSSAQ